MNANNPRAVRNAYENRILNLENRRDYFSDLTYLDTFRAMPLGITDQRASVTSIRAAVGRYTVPDSIWEPIESLFAGEPTFDEDTVNEAREEGRLVCFVRETQASADPWGSVERSVAAVEELDESRTGLLTTISASIPRYSSAAESSIGLAMEQVEDTEELVIELREIYRQHQHQPPHRDRTLGEIASRYYRRMILDRERFMAEDAQLADYNHRPEVRANWRERRGAARVLRQHRRAARVARRQANEGR